jgi:hypothetical protein
MFNTRDLDDFSFIMTQIHGPLNMLQMSSLISLEC